MAFELIALNAHTKTPIEITLFKLATTTIIAAYKSRNKTTTTTTCRRLVVACQPNHSANSMKPKIPELPSAWKASSVITSQANHAATVGGSDVDGDGDYYYYYGEDCDNNNNKLLYSILNPIVLYRIVMH